MQECVKVVVRCRPLNKKEIDEKRNCCVTVNSKIGRVTLSNSKSFTFDSVYDESSCQTDIYDQTAFPLIEKVLEGFNATIFAYGQTGCGKTWTMSGGSEEQRGIIPRSFQQVFESIGLKQETKVSDETDESKVNFLVRASYVEIYNEEILDLLEKKKVKKEMKEKENGVYIKDLKIEIVESVEDLERLLSFGTKNRTVGSTEMNAESSRSHSIFTLIVEISETIDDKTLYKVGKLNLVDLAGSERQTKTKAKGKRLKEGCKINLSLSSLGNVISALVDNSRNGKRKRHIPYRDSKLTRLLRDSLGGNTKTVMISNISPAEYNLEETLSTLRYADRAKRIKNVPVVNEDPKDALLKEYLSKIKDLQHQVKQTGDQEKEELIESFEKEKNEMKRELAMLKRQLLSQKVSSTTTKEDIREVRKKRETMILQKEKEKKEALTKIKENEDKELETETGTEFKGEIKKKAMKYLKAKLKKVGNKFKQDILDLENEFITEKEELLESIRTQNKEIKRLEQIIGELLKEEEIFRLWQDCEWNEDTQQWDIPDIQQSEIICQKCELKEFNNKNRTPPPLNTKERVDRRTRTEEGNYQIEGNKEISKLMKELIRNKQNTELESEEEVNFHSVKVISPKYKAKEEEHLPSSFHHNKKHLPRRLEPI